MPLYTSILTLFFIFRWPSLCCRSCYI